MAGEVRLADLRIGENLAHSLAAVSHRLEAVLDGLDATDAIAITAMLPKEERTKTKSTRVLQVAKDSKFLTQEGVVGHLLYISSGPFGLQNCIYIAEMPQAADPSKIAAQKKEKSSIQIKT